MTRRFWLLGSSDDMDTVGERLKCALGVDFQERESGYLGGRYLRGDGPLVHDVRVQLNFADDDGELAEAAFPRYPVLVYAAQELHEPHLDLTGIRGIDVLRVKEI